MAALPSSRAATVVVVHDHYREPGGEDRVFATEVALLRTRGHRVVTFTADNHEVGTHGVISDAVNALWNAGAAQKFRQLLRQERPDVVHLHNTFPLLSASLYGAARAEGAAVVQTLHNFRLVCPNALLHDGRGACDRCVGLEYAWPAVARACYRRSRVITTVAAASSMVHRSAGARNVDLYLALSELARDKFIAGGLPPDRIAVRPNFLADDPGVGPHDGGFALYVGRLSAEKGLQTLVDAWSRRRQQLPLRIVGTGPLEHLRASAAPGVEWLGTLPRDEVLRLMAKARLLVFPSECYENFPMVIVEAFATGLPVLAADGGVAADVVRRHAAGVVFAAGDAAALASSVDALLARPGAFAIAGRAARAAFTGHYTADRGYDSLIAAYERALDHRTGTTPVRTAAR